MNLAELKEDFYKRFNASGNFLTYSRAGLLCSLLGDISLRRCPALTCSLSMRVQVYGRRIDGNVIKLQPAKSNVCMISHLGGRPPAQYGSVFEMLNRMTAYEINGAEVVFDSVIPEIFDMQMELKAAIFETVSKIYELDPPVEICAGGDDATPYAALLEAKKGYCMQMPEKKRIPLPLTGYKIITVQCRKEDRIPRAKNIEKGFAAIKRIYPHISSFADVSSDMVEYTRSAIKDITTLNYLRHIADESYRVNCAAEGLKKCDVQSLAEQMNLSEESMEKLWNVDKQYVFLARSAMAAEGVICARIWKNGIISIADEDEIDGIVDRITYEFERSAGYKPFICIADSFGD